MKKKYIVNEAKSLGGALSSGIPVIFTYKDKCPEVVCNKGKEADALELLSKMGIIKIIQPVKITPLVNH